MTNNKFWRVKLADPRKQDRRQWWKSRGKAPQKYKCNQLCQRLKRKITKKRSILFQKRYQPKERQQSANQPGICSIISYQHMQNPLQDKEILKDIYSACSDSVNLLTFIMQLCILHTRLLPLCWQKKKNRVWIIMRASSLSRLQYVTHYLPSYHSGQTNHDLPYRLRKER